MPGIDGHILSSQLAVRMTYYGLSWPCVWPCKKLLQLLARPRPRQRFHWRRAVLQRSLTRCYRQDSENRCPIGTVSAQEFASRRRRTIRRTPITRGVSRTRAVQNMFCQNIRSPYAVHNMWPKMPLFVLREEHPVSHIRGSVGGPMQCSL